MSNHATDRRDQAFDEFAAARLSKTMAGIEARCGKAMACSLRDLCAYCFRQGYSVGMQHGIADAKRIAEIVQQEVAK